ncbi:MAG: polysaccharide export protein [Myxococcales bacterium]|nr:polysaccharide export protein [Myxococcales bacterium]
MRQVVAVLGLLCASTATQAAGNGDKLDVSAPPQAPAAPIDVAALEGDVRATSYVVGPGDKLHIVMWGLHELQQEIEVTAEGRLFVPRAGVFDAGGQTLSQLRARVEAKLHTLYPGLGSSLTLTRPRTFAVHVTGAVARPGTYAASPLTRVSAMLPKAGGALPTGSLRRVEIRRRGVEQAIQADLTRFALFGQVDQDPQVLDGDTVYVPPRQLTVEINGAVRRPGSYELIATRTLAELLELAGGFDTQASQLRPARVVTRTGGDRVVARSVPLSAISTTQLNDGDIVHIPELAEQRATVLVQGAVVGPRGPDDPMRARPSGHAEGGQPDGGPREVSLSMPYIEREGVRDLLARAGGLEPWADGRNAYLSRRAASGAAHHLPVDLVSVSTGLDSDVPVSPGDTLVVPARREQILVAGAVQRPGYYTFSGDLKPRDYLNLAGGLTRSADSEATRVLSNGDSRPLRRVSSVEPGDVITVPERRFTAADWTNMALILGNIAVGSAALGLAAANHR